MINRPRIDWIPVTERRPPKGQKVMGLSHGGTLVVGDLHDWSALPKPFIVCWQENPKKPDDWHKIMHECGW